MLESFYDFPVVQVGLLQMDIRNSIGGMISNQKPKRGGGGGGIPSNSMRFIARWVREFLSASKAFKKFLS